MLYRIEHLRGYTIRATDGDIGRVDDVLFDDRSWVARYVVADTGGWLSSRRVLLSTSMLERPEAHVVNVCSMFGLVGMPKLAAYSTAKFAMVGFSEVLRNECGRDGLGVTALCPGFVDTNLFTSAPLGEKQKEHKIPPRIFQTTPEKVAHALQGLLTGNVWKVLISIAIWLPYLLLSKRVNVTFRHRVAD